MSVERMRAGGFVRADFAAATWRAGARSGSACGARVATALTLGAACTFGVTGGSDGGEGKLGVGVTFAAFAGGVGSVADCRITSGSSSAIAAAETNMTRTSRRRSVSSLVDVAPPSARVAGSPASAAPSPWPSRFTVSASTGASTCSLLTELSSGSNGKMLEQELRRLVPSPAELAQRAVELARHLLRRLKAQLRDRAPAPSCRSRPAPWAPPDSADDGGSTLGLAHHARSCARSVAP
jgi:hypothetical protein